MDNNKINLGVAEQGKTVAIVSYLTIIGLIAALVMNSKNATSLGRFHIRQSIGLTVFALILGLLSFLPVIGAIVSKVVGIIVLIAFILGIFSAINKQEKAVPVVGGFIQKWLAKL